MKVVVKVNFVTFLLGPRPVVSTACTEQTIIMFIMCQNSTNTIMYHNSVNLVSIHSKTYLTLRRLLPLLVDIFPLT